MFEQLAVEYAFMAVKYAVLVVLTVVAVTWPVRTPGRHRAPESE